MSEINQVMKPEILMSREGSSMASTWEEYLCLSRTEDRWLLGEYGYNWAVNAYDLPENKQKRDDDELYVPEEWEGHKVLGIADGEYIETDELVSRGNDIEFDLKSVDKAIKFATDYEWGQYEGFREAMDKLKLMVSQSERTSK